MGFLVLCYLWEAGWMKGLLRKACAIDPPANNITMHYRGYVQQIPIFFSIYMPAV
jgi:hypothetical protein